MRYWKGSCLLDWFEGFAPQKPYSIEEDQDLICTILKTFYLEKGPDRVRSKFIFIVTDGVLHMPVLVHPNRAIDVFWPDRKFSKDNLSELEGRQILITSFALTAVLSENISLPYIIGMNWRPMKTKKQSIDPTVKCLWKDPLVLSWMDEYREIQNNASLSNDPDIKNIERRFGDMKSVNLDLQNVQLLLVNESDISETTLTETATADTAIAEIATVETAIAETTTAETAIAETTIIETTQEFVPASTTLGEQSIPKRATTSEQSSQIRATIGKQSPKIVIPSKRLPADKSTPPQNKRPRVNSSATPSPAMNITAVPSSESGPKINTQTTSPAGKMQKKDTASSNKGKNKASTSTVQSIPVIHKLGSNDLYNYKDIGDRTEIDLLRSMFTSNSTPFQQQSAYSLLCNLRYSQDLAIFEYAQRN